MLAFWHGIRTIFVISVNVIIIISLCANWHITNNLSMSIIFPIILLICELWSLYMIVILKDYRSNVSTTLLFTVLGLTGIEVIIASSNMNIVIQLTFN